MLDQGQAEVAQAEANNTKSQLDLKRYTPLVEKDVISKQQFDQAVATAQANQAAVVSAKANAIAAQEQIAVSRQQRISSQASQPKAPPPPHLAASPKPQATHAPTH